ncbi:MAG: DUF4335 domain-containing protein [Pseudanabaenales cyanobacterium]|nr:DUF4335 domain-containing protein [Pseudanabaenales cyanobacterium]
MTIQRQYSLPNCNLILEGLSTVTTPNSSPPMSVLVNAECHFPGILKHPLTGGREFIESLATAVSRYVQEQLSGIPQPHVAPADKPLLVQLKGGEGPYHHLIVQPQVVNGKSSDAKTHPPTDIKLTTVQLFDLLEAVDQLLADTQTLPDLRLDLTPIPRRLVKTQEPIAKRATPAAIGVSTLAAAAVLGFLLPVPELKIPERPPSKTELEGSGGGSDTPQPGPSPSPPNPSGDSDSPSQSRTDAPTAGALEETLEKAPEITDSDKLTELMQALNRQITQAWDDQPNFDQALVYRVLVSETGDIVNYTPENDAALANRDKIPLSDLAYISLDDELIIQEPVAQFKVTFTPNGNVAISPWQTPEGSTAPANQSGPGSRSGSGAELLDSTSTWTIGLDYLIPNEINDPTQIENLNQTLYEAIRDNRNDRNIGERLIYRVRVNQLGAVTGYESVNQAASNYLNQTPLPKLKTESGRERTDESEVDFKVVITPSGILEINPWRGWPEEF